MPAEQQDAAIRRADEAQERWIERFRHEQELRQTEPGHPADDRTRPWAPTHRVRGDDATKEILLMVLPNGQSFTRESWEVYRASPIQWSMYFNSPWVFWRGVWYLHGNAMPAGTVVELGRHG
ncbi:hypothetical protein HJC10_04045 [Corallococcus exiguus]|uniref:hypothetical protein n=1 Tax=Corallococcus exiguus TaxID=83462 RepID=UPI0014718149|nr:hypothetical protein [Corallococcus exiguus]NNB93401.1 hypothetical protein [Corallococcus exiguus]NNC02023.1 hypothetical protein [Corallococcus exiguus]